MSSICFSVLNDSECIFKQVKISEMFKLCDVVKHLRHFSGIVPSLVCILTKQHGFRSGKYLLKTLENAISETVNVKMSLGLGLGPQELIPLVRVPKVPTIYYQPAT